MNDKLVSQYNKRYAVSLLIMLLLYCFFTATSLLGPHYISVFIDEIVESASPSVIPVFLAKYGSVVMLCTITALLIKIIISKMENEILMDLRCTLFSKLISQPLSYFRVNSFGAVSEKILRDTNVVHSLWGYLIPSICSSVIVLVFTLFVILRKSPLIALLSIPSILIYVWVFRVFNGKLRQLFLNAREDADKVNNTMTDAWNGIQDLKIFHLRSWISRVLSLLDIDSIASKMPDGYDSIISEKGKNLSSGQIQRIAIARAILKPSSILILDEATSNVDSTSELIIQNSLNTLKQEKLIIIISHRLSSIKNADTIYVMSDGTFCQSGPFDKLASTDGCFKDLFAEQLYDHSI